MPRVEISNFDAVETTSKPLAVGTYRVQIESGEVKCKDGGTDSYVEWVLKVIDNEEEKLNGRTLYCITSLAAAALFKLKRFLLAAGVEFSNDGFDTESAIGQQLQVDVTQREYPKDSGEMKNEIVKFFSA